MTQKFGPERWAIEISKLLNQVFGQDHFPIKVEEVAREYSKQRFHGDAISLVKGADLPGFEGALYPAPPGKTGWGIIYNNRITSPGRVNFTLGHEFGHYLLHRHEYPKGLQCSTQDISGANSTNRRIEGEADRFAANLLMPLDDFRRQIPPADLAAFDRLSACADRYQVSLIATILRWLTYTSRRAVLVVSRDGYILWSRASEAALKSGAFFRTSAGPIAVPEESSVGRSVQSIDARNGILYGPGVWFDEEVREHTIISEQYDFAISLLTFENTRVGSMAQIYS